MSDQSQNSSLLYLRFKLKHGFVLFSSSLYFQMVSLCILMLYLSWNLMNTRTHHCWSMKIWKTIPQMIDFLLYKFFIKIISLDTSQRVPPMSPCPSLIITRGCPLLINPHVPNLFFFGFARSFPMFPIAFSQCFQSIKSHQTQWNSTKI